MPFRTEGSRMADKGPAAFIHWTGARVSILRSAVLPTTNSTDSGRGVRDERDRRDQRARLRTGTPDRRPVGVRAAGGLRLRQRLSPRAPRRSDNAAVARAGRPALVARRTRRRRGEPDD